jgi:hypothetical protein
MIFLPLNVHPSNYASWSMSPRTLFCLRRYAVSAGALAAMAAGSAWAGVQVVTFDAPEPEDQLDQELAGLSASGASSSSGSSATTGPGGDQSAAGGGAGGGGGGGAGGGGAPGTSKNGDSPQTTGPQNPPGNPPSPPGNPPSPPGGPKDPPGNPQNPSNPGPQLPPVTGDNGPNPHQPPNTGGPFGQAPPIDLDLDPPQHVVLPPDFVDDPGPQAVVVPDPSAAAAADVPELSSMLMWLGMAAVGAYGAKKRRERA